MYIFWYNQKLGITRVNSLVQCHYHFSVLLPLKASLCLQASLTKHINPYETASPIHPNESGRLMDFLPESPHLIRMYHLFTFPKFWDIPIQIKLCNIAEEKNIFLSSLWDVKINNFTPNLHMNKFPNHHVTPGSFPSRHPKQDLSKSGRWSSPKWWKVVTMGFFRDDEGISWTFKGCPAPYQDEPSLEIRSILMLFVKGSWRLLFI